MVFRIDLKIFIFFIILYFTRQIEIYWLIMVFAFLHEMGHFVAGIILKMKVKKMTIMPAGFSIEFALTEKDYNKKILKSNILEVKKIIVAAAGPMVNLILIAVTLISKQKNDIANNIIYSNLLILIFNLLPIYPLDGGRIMKSVLCLIEKRKYSIIYTNRVSNLTLFLITFIFSILIYYYKNWAILVVLMYLWYIVLKQNKICKMKLKLYDTLEKL
mgnify:FL=1